MPEAPEVEAAARTLRPMVIGRKIRSVHIRHAVAIRPQSSRTIKKHLVGARLRGVERRGKYLLLPLDHGCIVMHFKFDGQVLWFDQLKDALARNVHVDAAFETDGGTLGFVDPRHLGRVQWFAQPGDSPGIRTLGVDAFSPEFTPQHLANLCRESRQPLKMLLMDQKRVSGLGNIYATESLWQARLDPAKRSDRLKRKEARRLHKAVVSVLARALECCLHPPPNFRNPQWWFNGLEGIVCAYDREGESCARCGAAIRRIRQNGRSTYFCAACQRLKMTTANPASTKKGDAAKKPDFEYSLTRLEEIVGKLESANLSLDDAMKLFEEGVQLSRDCQKYLEQAEGKVEILLKKAGAEMAAEPFDPEAGEES